MSILAPLERVIPPLYRAYVLKPQFTESEVAYLETVWYKFVNDVSGCLIYNSCVQNGLCFSVYTTDEVATTFHRKLRLDVELLLTANKLKSRLALRRAEVDSIAEAAEVLTSLKRSG